MKYQHHLAAGFCGIFLLPGIASTAAAQSGHSWNTFEVDFNALGLATISSRSTAYKPPEEGAIERIATYRVAFSQAGSYDLYVRWSPGAFCFANSFGDAPQWMQIKSVPDPMGAYVWLNLSEKFANNKTGDLIFEVKAPGSETFKIATGTPGTRIDAFVFGKANGKFTDAQLDAAALQHPAAKTAGLFGMQAEAANAFGNEAVPEAVRKTQAECAERLDGLTQEIKAALPKWDDAKVAAWLAAVAAEEAPAQEAAAKAGAVEKMQAAEGNLKRMEEQLKLGPKTLEDAKNELEQARAMGENDPVKVNELASATKSLGLRQKEMDRLKAGVENAKAAVKEAEVKLPEVKRAAEAAKQAHEKALAATWKAMDALGMDGILGSAAFDGKLAQAMVIATANPRDLAEFAGKSPENQKLIQQLLANEALMVQMLVADGPTKGKFGEAMKIYTDIQKASPKAKEGVFQRLALAVSLAHSVPILKEVQRADDDADLTESAETNSQDASAFVDPVKRYLSYEKWYLDGELDQAFKDLSVWSLTMVVNGEESDECHAWGRQMLNNLRPDCIPNNGDTSVYVDVVDKEIAYTSVLQKDDLPERQAMENILANGGICGRRAFFGRFILRAFGVPAAARKQPGHATLGHWHPDGWRTTLGGDWGLGSRGFYSTMNDTRTGLYRADVNFLASTQARENPTAFMRVKRAQWIGAVVGEDAKPGLITWSGKTRGPAPKKKGEVEKPVFWTDLALHEQRRVITGLESKSAKSSSTPSVAAKEPAATGKATIDAKGVITIPSAACSSPTESMKAAYRGRQTDLVVFLKNKAGDTHLHLSRYSKDTDTFEYTFDAQKAGKYQLVASVVTPKPNQPLFATVNGGANVEIALPYTIGLWGKTAPVVVDLKAGRNVLKFRGPGRATFGQFTLTPAN